MNRSRARLARPLLVLLGAWCLSVSAPVAQTPLADAKDELKKMRTHLNAASNRFKGGMQSVRPSKEAARQGTPAMLCCEANLRVVRDRLVGFSRALTKLESCYRQLGDGDGLTRVGLVRADGEGLARGLDAFVRARSRDEAGRAMAGTTRAFILLDKDVRALTPCELPDETPLIEPEPPTSDPSGP